MSDLIVVYKKGPSVHLKSFPERGKSIAHALCFQQWHGVEDIVRVFDTERGEITDVDEFVSALVKYRDAVNIAEEEFRSCRLGFYRRVVTASQQ